MRGSGELEDGGRGAAEPMVEEDHGSKSSSTLTSSHAAMTEVLCICTFCCGAIHVHIYFTSASAGMLACVYGVAFRLVW